MRHHSYAAIQDARCGTVSIETMNYVALRQRRSGVMYKNILVPIDGSATARQALDEAVKLAQMTGGRITLMHVVDAMAHVYGTDAAVIQAQVRPAMLKAGEQLLEQAKEDIGDTNLDIQTHVEETGGGRVADAIVDYVDREKCDLIVLGTHGRRGIERIMMGSDAEQVARIAPVPVLLVRKTD